MPENLLSIDKFSEVMTDVQIMEAAFNQKMFREDDPKAKKAEFYLQIFEKHKVSEDDFRTSYEYYADRPEDMMVVYEHVITALSKKEETVNSSKEIQRTDRTAPRSAE